MVAHRTSPTNVGLLLISTVAAHDFGYTGTLELVERLELTLDAVDKMPKFRGHLFNWHDTRTLEPLEPQYISSVDSGNMAGHLLALKQACVELSERPLFGAHTLAGLGDTIALLRLEVERVGASRKRTEVVTINHLRDELTACADVVTGEPPESMGGWETLFNSLHRHASTADDMLAALAQEHGAGDFTEAVFWAGALLRQVKEFARDLRAFAPAVHTRGSHLRHVLSSDLAAPLRPELALALERVESPARVSEVYDAALTDLSARVSDSAQEPAQVSAEKEALPGGAPSLTTAIEDAASAVTALLSRLSRLARRCGEFFEGMDFRFLFDEERKVFRIGYNVTTGQPDNSYYDLLASESRLASFVAIAKGDAPQEHWFHLGRKLTPVDGSRALISWTATMFEYLMPLLVMRSYDRTLLDQTHRAVVGRQIEYGEERGVPWGISESAYNARDLYLNYQYGPFGVPGLGFKRGLSEDLVVAPYATMLAALVEPRRALANLRRLEREGALARYGFYESIDYTPERLPQKQKRVDDSRLHGAPSGHEPRRARQPPQPRRDAAALSCRAARAGDRAAVAGAHPARRARGAPARRRGLVGPPRAHADGARLAQLRHGRPPDAAHATALERHLLGDGHDGGRRLFALRSAWPSRAGAKTPCATVTARSATCATSGAAPSGLRLTSRRDAGRAHTKSPSRKTKLISGARTRESSRTPRSSSRPKTTPKCRRISLTNQSTRVREIELTSYAEVVLAPHAADVAHPAFSNLFIETEFVAAENALLARRRPRSSKDEPVYAVHVVVTEGERVGAVQYETDRSRFLGRGHTAADPVAVLEDRPLSNTVGAVLDPVFCLTPARAPAAGRDGAHHVHDRRGALARGGARSRRQVPRPLYLRARGASGVDAVAGRDAPPQH